jgi:hypothetical protein
MKLFVVLFLFSLGAFAQEPSTYFKIFDSKVYSLKTKGVKDFVVDLENTRLTKQINDQQSFGKIEELKFRVYWTAEPERISIEVMGLPEGFIEFKEELKVGIFQLMENLIPVSFAQKFNGYKFTPGAKQKEYLAQDLTGLAPIPSFTLKFDEQDKLIEVIGNKPVGSIMVKPTYEKMGFSDGKWVLREQVTTSTENGQTVNVSKELDYDKSQGIGVLSEITVNTQFVPQGKDSKVVKTSESVTFKNYKINEGEALRYFLGESKASESVKPNK